MGRRSRRLLVPDAREALNQLRDEVIAEKIRDLSPSSPLRQTQTSSPMSKHKTHQTSPTVMTAARMPYSQGQQDIQEAPLPYPLSKRSKPSEGFDRSEAGGPDFRQSQPSNPMNHLAESMGIPYRPDDNGNLRAKDAGALGGAIGGEMVKRLIAAAEQQLRTEPMHKDLQ